VEALSNPAAKNVTVAVSGKALEGEYEAAVKGVFAGAAKDAAA
jgi:hypothetical protein